MRVRAVHILILGASRKESKFMSPRRVDTSVQNRNTGVSMIQEGRKAPAFNLPSSTGDKLALKDLCRQVRDSLFLPEGQHAGLHDGSQRLQQGVA